MTKKIGLGVLCAFVLFLTACGAPADAPATAVCDALDKHATAVKDGKFDKAAFEKELSPLVADLAKHKDSTDNKVPMTEKVLERWQKSTKNFTDTAKDNMDALAAFITVFKPITG